MKVHAHLFSAALTLLGAGLAPAADQVLFTTGAPQAMDLGDGPNYYAVQSVLSTNWYPFEEGSTTVVADWFVVQRPSRITGVTFWGWLQDYGGGPGELHVFILETDVRAHAVNEIFHAWDENTADWTAFHVASEDPSGTGTDSVERWHIELSQLPGREGLAEVMPGRAYLLAVAGDDWADEFHWAHNAPHGLMYRNQGTRVTSDRRLRTLGQFARLLDFVYSADSTNCAPGGLEWHRDDLGYGSQANNLAFEVTGTRRIGPAQPSAGPPGQPDPR